MSCEYLLNADFDLSLRPRWRPPEGEAAGRRITDLAWHAIFLAGPDDSVLVPEPAPPDFIEYLDRSGLEAPALTVEPDHRSEKTLSPFGWNARAAELARRYDAPPNHPDIAVVTRINGRRFSAHLEDTLFDGGHTLAEIRSEAELLPRIDGSGDSSEGWILKAEHGNAGLGNRRLRTRDLSDGDLKAVRRLLEEDDQAILERWRPRLRDLCTTLTVAENGEATGIRLHEIINTADGALIGSLFEEDPAPLAQWRSVMIETAGAVADRLARAGFAGPVCIDAFVWDDNGRPRLRRLVDLNARREMSAGASTLWRRLGGHGAAYWRFFNRRKFDFRSSYRDLEDALGTDAFDPRDRTGALITAPLWLGPERRRPVKAAMLLFGRNRDEVIALDRRIRECFER